MNSVLRPRSAYNISRQLDQSNGLVPEWPDCGTGLRDQRFRPPLAFGGPEQGRKGELAASFVLAGVLFKGRRVSLSIEQVIDNLKGESQLPAKEVERRKLHFRRLRH